MTRVSDCAKTREKNVAATKRPEKERRCWQQKKQDSSADDKDGEQSNARWRRS